MKFFFTASIAATNGGEAHSAEAVRHRFDFIEIAVLNPERIDAAHDARPTSERDDGDSLARADVDGALDVAPRPRGQRAGQQGPVVRERQGRVGRVGDAPALDLPIVTIGVAQGDALGDYSAAGGADGHDRRRHAEGGR